MMTLAEAFDFREREVISLVGAGGKTTLMFALAEELASPKKGIILTTTTKIFEPSPSASFALFLSRSLREARNWVEHNLESFSFLVLAQARLENGKLEGIPPEWVEEVQRLSGVSAVIVEADGAAGRSLKAPGEGEPVVARGTTLLVPVVGIDILGCPLDERDVFRSEIASRVLDMPIGSPMTEEMTARLLQEIIPPGAARQARVIPFLNKVDLPGGLEKARNLARRLLEREESAMERIVLGQARYSPAVKEILFREG